MLILKLLMLLLMLAKEYDITSIIECSLPAVRTNMYRARFGNNFIKHTTQTKRNATDNYIILHNSTK
jgi:hypothetical protein